MQLTLSQYNINPAPRLQTGRVIGMTLLRAMKARMQMGRKRDKRNVDHQYNMGSWKAVYDARAWESAATLRDFVAPESKEPDDFIALMEGNLCRISQSQYYSYRMHKLHQIVEPFVSQVADDVELVEVGCGWGFNLFSLKEVGFAHPMRGFDISHYGVEAAREIDAHFGCGIQFDRNDLLEDDIAAAGSVIMTYYCLEQLKYNTEDVLNRIYSWSPARVIHIEPVIELYSNSFRDIASKTYITLRDYQNKLLTTLRAMEQRGQITILHAERQGYSPNILHEASCIVWEPRR